MRIMKTHSWDGEVDYPKGWCGLKQQCSHHSKNRLLKCSEKSLAIHLLFKKFYMCMGILPSCMSVHHVHASHLKSVEGARPPWNWSY